MRLERRVLRRTYCNLDRPMVSHTTTGEWKSFEQRMRRRRAERLLLRADIAAEAGFLDDARAAVAEAQRLCPTLPDIPVIEERIRTAEASPAPVVAAVPRYPPHTYASILAALVIVVIGGVWQTSHVAHLPAHSVAAIVPMAPAAHPSSAAVPRVDVLVEHLPLVSTVGTTGRTIAEPVATAPEPPARTVEPVAQAALQAADPQDDRARSSALPLPVQTSSEVPGESVQPIADVSLRTAAAPPVLNLGQPVATVPSTPAPNVDGGHTVAAPADETLVRRTLGRYASAYNNLDANAAQTVWPGVNRGALARAFDDLASQQVSLGNCRIDINARLASAVCSGSMTWAPKVGSGAARTEPRNWRFDLAKAGDDWHIVSARVQNR